MDKRTSHLPFVRGPKRSTWRDLSCFGEDTAGAKRDGCRWQHLPMGQALLGALHPGQAPCPHRSPWRGHCSSYFGGGERGARDVKTVPCCPVVINHCARPRVQSVRPVGMHFFLHLVSAGVSHGDTARDSLPRTADMWTRGPTPARQPHCSLRASPFCATYKETGFSCSLCAANVEHLRGGKMEEKRVSWEKGHQLQVPVDTQPPGNRGTSAHMGGGGGRNAGRPSWKGP